MESFPTLLEPFLSCFGTDIPWLMPGITWCPLHLTQALTPAMDALFNMLCFWHLMRRRSFHALLQLSTVELNCSGKKRNKIRSGLHFFKIWESFFCSWYLISLHGLKLHIYLEFYLFLITMIFQVNMFNLYFLLNIVLINFSRFFLCVWNITYTIYNIYII